MAAFSQGNQPLNPEISGELNTPDDLSVELRRLWLSHTICSVNQLSKAKAR